MLCLCMSMYYEWVNLNMHMFRFSLMHNETDLINVCVNLSLIIVQSDETDWSLSSCHYLYPHIDMSHEFYNSSRVDSFSTKASGWTKYRTIFSEVVKVSCPMNIFIKNSNFAIIRL